MAGHAQLAKVESRRELLVEGKVEEETRYYISSLPGDAKQIGHAVRASESRTWYSATTTHTERARQLRHARQCCGAARANTVRGRHIAGWDEDFLYSLLTT